MRSFRNVNQGVWYTISTSALLACFLLPLFAQAQEPSARRHQQWREDLQYLKERFPAYDKTLTPFSFLNPADSNKRYLAAHKNVVEDFIAGIDSLQRHTERLSDEAIMIGMCRLIALSPNAHTRLYLFRVRTVLNNLPIGIGWFEDDVYITAAPPAYKGLPGARIRAINGVEIDSVKKRVDELISGNASWKRYMSLYFLRSPQVMKGLGLSNSGDTMQLTLLLPNGKESTVTLKADFVPQTRPQEIWKDLSPVTVKRDSLQHVLAKTALPLYLSQTHTHYWYTHLEQEGLLYLQFNRTENSPSNTFSSFIDSLVARMKDQPYRKFVLDLRFNTGGNNDIAAKGLHQLAAHVKDKAVYIFTGPATFSAGITTASLVKQLTGAKVVGEPVGDGLIYLSEGGNVILPHSKLYAHYANGIHVSYPSKGFSLQPDQAVAIRFADYLKGQDPLLQYVLDQR